MQKGKPRTLVLNAIGSPSSSARLTLQESYQVEQLSVVVVSVPARNAERVVGMHLRGVAVPVDDNNLNEKEKNPN